MTKSDSCPQREELTLVSSASTWLKKFYQYLKYIIFLVCNSTNYCYEILANTRLARAFSSFTEGHKVMATCVKLAIWLLTWTIFIMLEFGAIFFLASLLVFIFINTTTRPKQSNEPSAYSVFNRNCERILGTFTAEQFEQQLRTGSLWPYTVK